MHRGRLVLLVASALLSTSIQPLGEAAPAAEDAPLSAGLPAVSAPPPAAVEQQTPAQETEEDRDRLLVAEILRRLSIRHTALSTNERTDVANAILREARRNDLDPDLVMAVIEVESAGYHLAVSHVGAMGLMQLLPATGEELAGKLDIPWNGDDTLFDPIVNVRLGTAYLRELANRYGDVSVALAAYNWGPGRIDRRLRRGAAVPSRYIEQVMRAYDRGQPSPASRRS